MRSQVAVHNFHDSAGQCLTCTAFASQTHTAHRYCCLLKVPTSRHAQPTGTDVYSNVPTSRHAQPTGTDVYSNVPTSRHAQPTGTDVYSNVPPRRQMSIGRILLLSDSVAACCPLSSTDFVFLPVSASLL